MEEQTSNLGIIVGCLIVGLFIGNLVLMYVAVWRGTTATIVMSAVVNGINLIGAAMAAFGPADGPEGGEAGGRGICGAYFVFCLLVELGIFAALLRRMNSATPRAQPPQRK